MKMNDEDLIRFSFVFAYNPSIREKLNYWINYGVDLSLVIYNV
jgi:hypothetical protein